MPRRKTALLKPDGTADYTCATCNRTATLTIPGPVRPSTPVRTRYKCECGTPHSVYLERRTTIRKEVSIDGTFRAAGADTDQPMTVLNLSRSGVLFEAGGGDDLEVGGRLQIGFSIGGRTITRVDKQVTIRRVDGRHIAAVFSKGAREAPLDPHYDLALAQYNPFSRRNKA